ncbi:MAG: hypothetical protein WC415_04495 [Patescibacteria group bacterium]|jgi:3D (Asp-Asp-Asp) domain-containing protein
MTKYLILAKRILEKNKKKVILAVLSWLLINLVFSPIPVLADDNEDRGFDIISLSADIGQYYQENILKILNPEVLFFKNKGINNNRLPENNDLLVNNTKTIVFTAYNSEVGQCDDSPCITANGFNVCKHGAEDTIAMNGIKFGTKLRIPELFGDKVFVVRDRMNTRYDSNRGDIWMVEKKDAKTFGVKIAKVEFLQ